jgi:hypothetical protein
MRMRPEEFQVYRIATTPQEVLDSLELFEVMLKHDNREYNPAEKPFQL